MPILRIKNANGEFVAIPSIKGDKGEKGDKGDPGTYHVDPTQSIAGTAADAAAVGEMNDDIQNLNKALYNDAIKKEVSGTVVDIDGCISAQPASLVTTFTPWANVAGWKVFRAYRAGKNIFDKLPDDAEEQRYTNLSGTSIAVKGHRLSLPVGEYGITARYVTNDEKLDTYFTFLIVDEQNRLVPNTSKSLVTREQTSAINFTIKEGQQVILFNSSMAQSLSLTKTKLKRIDIVLSTTPVQRVEVSVPDTAYNGVLDWTAGKLTMTTDADGNEQPEPRIMTGRTPRLNLLEGYNSVWSSPGDTYIKYIVGTQSYIDEQIAALKESLK